MKDIPEARILFGFFVPLGQRGYRHFDVAAQLFWRMAAQIKAVEEGRLALGEREVVGDFDRALYELCRRGHKRKGSLPKSASASSSTGDRLSRAGQLSFRHHCHGRQDGLTDRDFGQSRGCPPTPGTVGC